MQIFRQRHELNLAPTGFKKRIHHRDTEDAEISVEVSTPAQLDQTFCPEANFLRALCVSVVFPFGVIHTRQSITINTPRLNSTEFSDEQCVTG